MADKNSNASEGQSTGQGQGQESGSERPVHTETSEIIVKGLTSDGKGRSTNSPNPTQNNSKGD